jgi:capsule polysaccharide export protein KpsE/RkpR
MRSRIAPELEPEVEIPALNEVLEPGKEVPERTSLDLARVLWEQRALIGRWVRNGLLLSTLIALLIPKSYEATTRLMPPDNGPGAGLAMVAAMFGKSAAGLEGLASDLLGAKKSGALFVDLLGSRTVQDRIVDRFNLRKVYSKRYQEDARKELTKHTSVSEDRKSGVLIITVEDHNPQRATDMAQAYVEELDRLVAQVSTSAARRERIFIEQRLHDVKHDLDNASQQFSQYASQNTIVDINAQTKAMVEGAARLQGELIAAQSELQGLEQIYSDNNIRVRSLKARVAELQSQLAKMGGNSTLAKPVGSGPSPGSNPDSGTGASTEAYDLYPPIRQLPLLGVRWVDLYRETKIQETIFELLTQQYEMAKIQEAKEIPTVKVVDKAVVPEKKSFPPRLLFMLLGLLVSFALASAWVIGTTSWHALDAQDPRKTLAREVVTVSEGWLRRSWERAKSLRSRRPSAVVSAPENGTGNSDH